MLNTTAFLIFIFIFGLCVGSFLNVVIYRLPRRKSFVFPRSECTHCHKLIPWYRNIPVVSFLLLRGQCGDCGKKISIRYPFVEILTGILFTFSAYRNPTLMELPFHFYFIATLIACTFIDIDHWILPDKLTIPGMAVGFLASIVTGELHWTLSLAGFALGGGLLLLVSASYKYFAKRDGLGGGDIKFLAMVGAFLGMQGALITLVLSSILGSIFGIALILKRGKRRSRTAIQFGPFLAFAAWCAFHFGDFLWQWYFNQRI